MHVHAIYTTYIYIYIIRYTYISLNLKYVKLYIYNFILPLLYKCLSFKQSSRHALMHLYLVIYFDIYTHLHALGILLITRSEDIKIRLFKSFSGNQNECAHLTNVLLTHTQWPQRIQTIVRVTQCINHNEEKHTQSLSIYIYIHKFCKFLDFAARLSNGTRDQESSSNTHTHTHTPIYAHIVAAWRRSCLRASD